MGGISAFTGLNAVVIDHPLLLVLVAHVDLVWTAYCCAGIRGISLHTLLVVGRLAYFYCFEALLLPSPESPPVLTAWLLATKAYCA